MRKIFSAFYVALSALCVFCLFALSAHGQDRDGDREKVEAAAHPNGIVQDWSHRHVVFPRVGPIEGLIAVQRDPRALLSWQAEVRRDWHRSRFPYRPRGAQSVMHRDWAISLGTGSTAAAMFPAKFGLDVNAAANCANDFIVYPVNVAGSGTQPNIVAFNNLYSGGSKVITGNTNSTITVAITAGIVTAADIGQAISGTGIPLGDTIATVTGNPATSLTLTVAATATNAGIAITIGTGTAGFCNGHTQGAADNPLLATTMWSYDINAVGGTVATSPALSQDGTKIAFVETTGAAAHFHVLAPKSGDGVDAVSAQNVLLPKTISSFDATAPAAGSGAVTDLSFGATSDTLSSPFVDYNTDTAYVGNDAGVLFRFKNVFCTTAACAGAAPSLDLSWNSTGSVTLGSCVGKVTGAVVDSKTGHIFAGCSDGKLYGFTVVGSAISGSPFPLGDGTATGGIVDPPMIDAVNGFVYAVSGSNGAGSSVLVQANTATFTTPTPGVATLGSGGSFSLHAPAFNNAYYNGAIANALIYDWAVSGGNIALYGVTFSGPHTMTTGAAANSLVVGGSTPNEFSPVTEFLNGANDQLFVGGITASTPNFFNFTINSFPGSFSPAASIAESGGSSGIVVDDNSADAQASSVYFSGLGANTNAIKLTQTGLL